MDRELINESRTTRLGVDLFIFTILGIVGYKLLSSRPTLLVLYFVLLIWFIALGMIDNFVIVESRTAEMRRLKVISTVHPYFLSPSLLKRTIYLLTVAFSGVNQLYNKMSGDDTYLQTKKYCLSSLLSFCPNTEFMEMGNPNVPLPRKFFIFTQHVPCIIDLFAFMHFIPKGYKIRVVHDMQINTPVKTVMESVFLKPLYGAVLIDKSNKESMKKSFEDVAMEMIESEDPVVVVSWPSGSYWDFNKSNGIKEFKNGSFILSAFTGYPMCIVHSKLNDDKTKCISYRSEFVSPLTYVDSIKISTDEIKYRGFLDMVKQKEIYKYQVDEYRRRGEKLYREIDEKLFQLTQA